MINQALMKQILPLLIFLLLFSALRAQTDTKAAEFFKKGMDYKEKNMLTEAFYTFQKAITLNKKYDSAYVELGSLCMRGNFYDSAISFFNQAIAVNPNMASAYIALGNVYRDFKPNHDSAIICYKSVLKTDNPDSLKKVAYYSLAWCYNAKEEFENAIPYGIKALEIDNNCKQAYGELGYAYRRSKKYAEGIAQFKKNLAVSVVDLAYLYSGLCYTQLNDKEGALKEYEDLKKINEKMAAALKRTIDKMQ
jgi:tetratricopeptide (TPR) repeat protein